MNDSLIGQQLDEYRLEALLGRGGMARVYRALDVRLKRYAAVKVIDTPFREDSAYLARFEREAQTIAQLDHPHIVRLYRYGEVGSLLYMAMEYVEGADLASVLSSYRQDGEYIEAAEAARMVREVSLALDYAHGQGVIHRDVKPSNIILDKRGRAILTDFGLALMVDLGTQGEVFGTPQYIAPEQIISSAGARPQSDLYSMGVILYEMFGGRLPFDAPDTLEVARRQLTEPPTPLRQLRPDISPGVEAVILKMLHKDPEQRYPSGASLAAALEGALRRAEPITAATRLTVPERVALQLSADPLPPIAGAGNGAGGEGDGRRPTAEIPPVPLVAPVPAPAPAARAGRRGPLLLAVAAVLALCLLAAGGVFLSSRLGGPGDAATEVAGPGIIGDDAPTPTLRPPPEATATSRPTATPTAAPTTPAPTPIPPSVYLLQIVTRRDESLFLINLGPRAFPLEELTLRGNESRIDGEEWDVEELETGECVTAWKSQGSPEPPRVTCERVGDRLMVHSRDVFWNDNFEVVFGGQTYVLCTRSEDTCLVELPAITSGE